MPFIDKEFDLKHLWHPYTCATSPDKVYPVIAAEGCKLTFENGDKLVDAMASWWSVIHGYSHPVLVEALKKQAGDLSHVMFGGLTHGPAVSLGKKLLSILPSAFENIFFADSGSVAVEVAMKAAVQFQQNRGFPKRRKFLTVKNGYHGDTAGAMSVCDPENGMHSLFSAHIQKQFFAPAPPLGFGRETNEEDLFELRKTAEENQDEIAAVIIEPIVQGAGGMRIYSPKYLEKLRKICDEYEFLLIFDEIATGFGRTGKLFAFEHTNILPDIICIGKALTGGMLTLSAMLCSSSVAKTACLNGMPLMHGPTFMANPLACACATANLNLLTSWDWQKKVLYIQKRLEEELFDLKQNTKVTDVRVLGAIGVVEMKKKINTAQFQLDCIKHGAWLRPFGKLAYIMPPYIIEERELKVVTNAIKAAIDGVA